MSIRYQADNDLNQLIVAARFRKEPGIDFKTAQNAQLDRLGDVTVLRQAASEGCSASTTGGLTRPVFTHCRRKRIGRAESVWRRMGMRAEHGV